jgi:SHS2 domain-containing protein
LTERADPRQGHRSLPHTADIRIEAWGPTREACLAEAVAALVDSFADRSGARPTRTVHADLVAETDEDALVAVLDEVIYLLDTEDAVPLDAEVQPLQGGVRLRLPVVSVRDVELVGAVPKAVALHELRLTSAAGRWSCAATTDV